MGKVKKCTEYYCDICKGKIQYSAWNFTKDRFYKIKCYDEEGKRRKVLDYSYVCNTCMNDIVKKVKEMKKNANR